MDSEIRANALELTRKEKFVYVSTVDEGGYPETRVMFNLLQSRANALSQGPSKVPSDFASYLATNTASRKVALMRKDNRVCLYYSDNSGFSGCMVRGRVSEVLDDSIRKAVWTDEWNMYYQGGVNGGDFTVLLFTPEHVRYYQGLAVTGFDV